MSNLSRQLYNGTANRAVPQLAKKIPVNAGSRHCFENPDTRDLQYTRAPGVDITSTQTIVYQGSVRTALPLRGIHGTDRFHPITLRPQPVSYLGTIYPKQGYSRHQKKGLATLKEKPQNLPIMKQADFYDPGRNSKLS